MATSVVDPEESGILAAMEALLITALCAPQTFDGPRPIMPSFKDQLSEDQVNDLVAFLTQSEL